MHNFVQKVSRSLTSSIVFCSITLSLYSHGRPDSFDIQVSGNDAIISWEPLPNSLSGIRYQNAIVKVIGPNNFSELTSHYRLSSTSLSEFTSLSLSNLDVGFYSITGKAAYEEGDDEEEFQWEGIFEIGSSGVSRNVIFIHTDLLGSPAAETDESGNPH